MKCDELDRLFQEWESSPEIDDSFLGDTNLQDHLKSCPLCRSRYGMLTKLVNRTAFEHHSTSSSFADNVMRNIKPVSNPWFLSPLVAAAALILVFGAGYLFRGTTDIVAPDVVEIRFTFVAPQASSVVLVGNLPGILNSGGLPLEKGPDGLWQLKVQLKKNEVYTYNYLVDGQDLFIDPLAEEVVSDGFGGENALIRI